MGKSKDLATGAAYQDQTESDTRYVNTAGDTMTGNLAINNASGSQVTLHRTDTTIANDDLYGQIILSGDDADTNASGTRGYIRGRSQGSGGGLKMEFGTAGGGVAMGSDPRMTINADGIVTKPNQPMFRIRCANNNNVNGTLGGGVNLAGTGFYQSNTLVQTGGTNFSVSTGRFTAPVAGYYYFNFSNRVDSVGSGYVYFTILDNGGSVITRNLTSVNTTYQTLHCSAVHYMSANDYVYVNYLSSSDQYVNLDSDGFFSGFLVG